MSVEPKKDLYLAQIKVLEVNYYRDGGSLGIMLEVNTNLGPLPLTVRVDKDDKKIWIQTPEGEEKMTDQFKIKLLEALDVFVEKDRSALRSLEARRDRIAKVMGLLEKSEDSHGFEYETRIPVSKPEPLVNFKDGDILIKPQALNMIKTLGVLNKNDQFVVDKGSLRSFQTFLPVPNDDKDLFHKIGSVCLSK